MTRPPHHEGAEPLPSARSTGFAQDLYAQDLCPQPLRGPDRVSAELLPFPAPGARRPRRRPDSHESRGEILFFLGVRYERLAS